MPARRLRPLTALAASAVALVALAVPAGAITFGQLDGDRHPNVGALVAPIGRGGAPVLVCSGTLVSPTVFVTAAHCTDFLPSLGVDPDEVWVTFDATFGPAAALLPGTYQQHPRYGKGGASNTYDVAVVVLDAPAAGITPASLPTAGLLNRLRLKGQRFTAVGYGTVRDAKEKGQHSLAWDPQRRYVSQGFLALRPAWLQLSMNPSTGSGGTCYGDSGGPHFLGSTSTVVALTVTGDRFCRATDTTYRLDTPWARAFLGQFVALP